MITLVRQTIRQVKKLFKWEPFLCRLPHQPSSLSAQPCPQSWTASALASFPSWLQAGCPSGSPVCILSFSTQAGLATYWGRFPWALIYFLCNVFHLHPTPLPLHCRHYYFLLSSFYKWSQQEKIGSQYYSQMKTHQNTPKNLFMERMKGQDVYWGRLRHVSQTGRFEGKQGRPLVLENMLHSRTYITLEPWGQVEEEQRKLWDDPFPMP